VFVVDTNVLVYAANRGAPEHVRCRELLLAFREQATPWYLTWGIAYEFLRIATHPRVFRAPWSPGEAWSFLEALLASPALGFLVAGERHAAILAGLVASVPQLAGNLVHDAHTAALMREHGLRVIYTRDNDFHRFPGVEVRDPLA
jgi:uncharacterized protein